MTIGLWDQKLVIKWAKLESLQAIWKAIHDNGFPLPRWSSPDGNLHKWHPGDVRMWMLQQRRREQAFENAWGGQPLPEMVEPTPPPAPKSKYAKAYERQKKDIEGASALTRQGIKGLHRGVYQCDVDPLDDDDVQHFISHLRLEDE